MYISLARKYRPKNFTSVAVQSHVSNTLKGAIARGRVAHGYLLCGPRGVGKTTVARVLAMALNCERRAAAVASGKPDDGEPCGECASCQRIWSGAASLDVIEIDAASNRGVDDARELRERAMYAPSAEGRYKVYIVDEAHMLTREAWNALLKILEEPPPRVIFVFATTEPQKIAQAAAPVLSRLQRFDFKRIGPADVRSRLASVLATERVEAEDEALAMIARAADGSMRDALSLTDQVLSLGERTLTVKGVRDALGLVAEDEYIAMLDLVAERRAAEIFSAVARLVDAGVDLEGFLSGFADVLRAQLAIALGGTAPEMSERAREALVQRRERLPQGDLLRMLTTIAELEPRFRRSGQQQILLETLLVRFALMDRTVALEEVLRELGGRAGSGGGGGGDGSSDMPRGEGTDVRRQTSAVGGPAVPTPSRPRSEASGRATLRDSGATQPPAEPHAEAREVTDTGNGPPGAPPRIALQPLAERWGDVIARARADGRHVLAAALEHARPTAVSARGEITLELEGDAALFREPIEMGTADALSAIGALFSGASALQLRTSVAASSTDAAPRRLTLEGVRAERLNALRKRDPALDAAVEALDLELLE